ncbi:MAG: hypothetical protein LBD03_04190 [Methanobrevibacter sp.]|nr:hypothetical protein [Candidatus Methanovirga procula]
MDGDTIKTKPKHGNSRFFVLCFHYMCILRNKHYTLAVKYIRRGDSLRDTVDFLINEIQNNGFKVKGLLP